MVRVKIAPDVEFRMDIEIEGIDRTSRDHDVQLHKEKVYKAFAERIGKAFPKNDVKIDTFSFGLEREEEPVKTAP